MRVRVSVELRAISPETGSCKVGCVLELRVAEDSPQADVWVLLDVDLQERYSVRERPGAGCVN